MYELCIHKNILYICNKSHMFKICNISSIKNDSESFKKFIDILNKQKNIDTSVDFSNGTSFLLNKNIIKIVNPKFILEISLNQFNIDSIIKCLNYIAQLQL